MNLPQETQKDRKELTECALMAQRLALVRLNPLSMDAPAAPVQAEKAAQAGYGALMPAKPRWPTPDEPFMKSY